MHPAILPLLLTLTLCTSASAQNPTGKAITIEDMRGWNRITGQRIGADGRHVLYTLTKDVGDPVAVLYNTGTGTERRYPRLHQATLSYDGRHLIGLLKPTRDTVRHVKLTEKKKAEDKLAEMDSLLVLDLNADGAPVITPRVYGYQLAERDARSYAYTTASNLPDSLIKDLDEDAKRLVVRNFSNMDSFYLEGVMDYVIARDAPVILAARTDKDSTWLGGVHLLDTRELKWQALAEDSLNYRNLALTSNGDAAAYLSREKDPDDQQTPYQINYYRDGELRVGLPQSAGNPMRGNEVEPLQISTDRRLAFNAKGDLLYFGHRPRLPEKDTTLLGTEIADVEVWTTDDPKLYTQRNVQLKEEKKRTYLSAVNFARGTVSAISTRETPNAVLPPNNDGDYAIAYDDRPYAKEATWAGYSGTRDVSLVNLESGGRDQILQGVAAPARFLEGGDYLVWYNRTDTTWNSFDPSADEHHVLTNNDLGVFYDELNDRPMHPGDYGYVGTLQGGRKLLINDRYDIWELDAAGSTPPRRITRGREAGVRYFLQDLNPEIRFVDPREKQLVETFDQNSFAAGFGWLDLATGEVESLRTAPKTYGGFLKARSAESYIFTEADFRQYPDIQHTTDLGSPAKVISSANPQQNDFRWGTAENYEWVDNQGRTLKGLLIKPDGFDPDKQYPLLVNFYERSSEGVHRHRTPVPGRSSINYAHYVSKGYVIFNPDVVYRIGYPGESAYDCVMSGVTSLIQEGYIDRERIGAQGHSWGGYQVAYLATKTNLFRAIESGAPVVNMFSAYGGIRWGSGLSRQFQYEHTQSRIGGSPWEYPLRYMENSPIFTVDKIETPILILHNDGDGAVPWYQGIEFYTAMRRLDKQAWLLNYRGEPHWPVKTPNRTDFQTRMEQFFDHYLMDQPMPAWMKNGVAPIDRGINQGLETETR